MVVSSPSWPPAIVSVTTKSMGLSVERPICRRKGNNVDLLERCRLISLFFFLSHDICDKSLLFNFLLKFELSMWQIKFLSLWTGLWEFKSVSWHSKKYYHASKRGQMTTSWVLSKNNTSALFRGMKTKHFPFSVTRFSIIKRRLLHLSSQSCHGNKLPFWLGFLRFFFCICFLIFNPPPHVLRRMTRALAAACAQH